MIYFAIFFFTLLIIAGYIVSKNKKALCTLCEKNVHNPVKINDQVYLCDLHNKFYQEAKIKPFLCVHCTPTNHESGIYLYELFKLFIKHEIYSHIITDYDLIDDQIETKQTLFLDYEKVNEVIRLLK
jgi:hypothetical protein